MKIIGLLLVGSVIGSETANMKRMLDNMASYYERNSTYDDVYFNANLTTCLKWLDDDILTGSQDHSWAEFDRYWQTNGTAIDWQGNPDHWGSHNTRLSKQYVGSFGDDQMIVYEPCNYVSNVAYFRSVTRICDYPNWTLSNDYVREFKR